MSLVYHSSLQHLGFQHQKPYIISEPARLSGTSMSFVHLSKANLFVAFELKKRKAESTSPTSTYYFCTYLCLGNPKGFKIEGILRLLYTPKATYTSHRSIYHTLSAVFCRSDTWHSEIRQRTQAFALSTTQLCKYVLVRLRTPKSKNTHMSSVYLQPPALRFGPILESKIMRENLARLLGV
jgi:hypothetical protein